MEQRPPAQIAEIQLHRAMELVRLAWDNSDFYRELYSSAGIRRKDLDHSEVFSSLPILEKSHLREFGARITRTDVPQGRLLRSSTGGSTGQPLMVFHDKAAPVAAMWWSVYRWWGLNPSIDTAFIQRERRTSRAQALERMQWWPTTRIYLDSRQMSKATMVAFARQLQLTKPTLLTGYAGGVYEFADFVAREGILLPDLRAVGVTAAPLPRPQRAFIEAVLGAPVYDQYRSAEVPWMAAQCRERDGLHVLAGVRVLEIVDSSGKPQHAGTLGDIVITDLCNRVFPLIRYRIGDRSAHIADKCRCGMNYPRIETVKGRISDVIRLPSGQLIAGGLTGIFNADPDAVRQFQLHQHADYSITLRCVSTGTRGSLAILHRVADELRDIVSHSVPVKLEIVDTISHDRGKARIILSEAAASPLENS